MDKTVLITGAANRIGAAIAFVMAKAGYTIIVHFNRSETQSYQLCEKIQKAGGNAAPLQADLSNKTQREKLLSQAAAISGPVHTLINNASVFEPDSALTLDDTLWDIHFDLHAKTPLFLARDFARQLPAGTKGNIINIIDERVLRNDPGYLSYSLSKSVLWTATKSLAQSLAPHIRVNAIGPGPTLPHKRQSQAQFEKSIAQLPLQTAATPDDIANAVLFLLNTPSMTGQMLAMDGGEHLDWRGGGRVTPAFPGHHDE